ncbi:Fanconi anaemia protein FANCD2 [Trinorchestia longiramus]|nr:Fanconi anaemia protein FANCD2 [Trinorchestia longiramus]
MPSLKRPTSGVGSNGHSFASRTNRTQSDSEDLFACSSAESSASRPVHHASAVTKTTSITDVYEDDSIFCKYVTEGGMVLRTNDSPNMLSCDRLKFQHSISKKFNFKSSFLTSFKHGSTQNTGNLDEFLNGLEEYLKMPHCLKWSLLYTEAVPDSEVGSRGNQDSLIRLLLNVDVLQPRLVTLLTDTLLALAYEQSSVGNTSLPALLLGNLRWLDFIVEPERLADAVIMVLLAATEQVQREIIHFIPNIITDEFHERVADAFTEHRRYLLEWCLDGASG